MKGKKMFIGSVLLIFVMVFALAGCSGGSDQGKQEDKTASGNSEKTTLITVGTATVGGAWYPMGGGLANLISAHVPNTKATATPSGASIENLNSIKNKKMEIGFATADIPYKMYRGIETDKNDSFRTMVMNDVTYLVLAVKSNSPIKKFEDIKGKTLGTGVPGSSTYEIVDTVLKAHGMTKDDVKLYPAGIAQQAEALKDGNIDMFACWIAGTGGAAPALVELATTADIRLIPLSDEIASKINSERPYFIKTQIAAGWLKGLSEPVTTLKAGTAICVSKDLPDDLVYNIVKAMFEFNNELVAVHPNWKYTNKESAAKDMPVPLHPGAEKYYKEIGAEMTYITEAGK